MRQLSKLQETKFLSQSRYTILNTAPANLTEKEEIIELVIFESLGYETSWCLINFYLTLEKY